MLIFEILIIAGLVGVLYVHSKVSKISFDKIEAPIKINEGINEDVIEHTEDTYRTVALFGVDNRSNGNLDSGNSDVIIIASINENTKKVRLMSVYRDSSFDVDGNGMIRKANYAYAHGGPQDALAMLNRNLDLNIQDYVTVDFRALVDAVDAVGGIEMTLSGEEAMWANQYMQEVAKVTKRSPDPIEPGTHVLSGVQVTGFCRVRYAAGGDLRRAEVQREAVTKLAEKAKHASIGELNALIDAVFPEVATSFSLAELMSLAADAASYEIEDTAGFPFSMYAKNLKGKYGWLDFPCDLEKNVSAMYYYLYDVEDYQVSKTVQNINDDIINLSGVTADSAQDFGYGTLDTKMEEWKTKRALKALADQQK